MVMAAAVETVPVPVSAQAVANAFVQQYYHILRQSPGLVHRFYQEISKLGRPEEDGSMSITSTLQGINEKIMSLNYGDFGTEIKSVDAQDSHNGGVHVLVTGYLSGKGNALQKFAQSFFLAPQDNGYYVLNDMFRHLEDPHLNQPLVNEIVVPASEDSVTVPVLGDNPSEVSTQSVEEAASGVYNPPQNGDVTIEDEVPVPEVIDQVQDDAPKVVESISKLEEGPKKSYASIVMHLKESAATFSPPPPARKALPKAVEPAAPTPTPATDAPASVVDVVENENNQEGEADGYSIYIKGLPMNATAATLEEVFKKFGAIKTGGIQVRSNRHQGFCFGFVEFEEAAAVQKALEASPVIISGRQAFVEEKRSTNSRGNNRGRFQSGRGSGFRTDGSRGRGNYGGGRGYNSNSRADFNGRNEFSNRNSSRARPSSRDGYHRSDNFNGNMGRANQTSNGGLANGNVKNMTPYVSATA